MYSNKLQNAKDIAMKVMLKNASRAGADGIIGVDIDYATFSADIMGGDCERYCCETGKNHVHCIKEN